MIFGIHADKSGGQPALTAKVEDTVWKRMYEKLSAMPIPSESPIPPLRFSIDSDTPIMVRMNAANGEAMRL